MKKEICAIMVLLLLIAGAIGNIIHLKQITEQISSNLNYALLYCSLEDYEAVYTETVKAQKSWTDAEKYTHVFIRHSEIDKINEIFYDILSAAQNKEKYETDFLLQKLQHFSNYLVKMETASVGSIF